MTPSLRTGAAALVSAGGLRASWPLACLLVACSGQPSEDGRPAEAALRPHVVLIVVDDLGWGDVGFTGGDLKTPRLDALACQSLVLERFYAAPMCTPSRAQLLTGQNALSLGITRNVKPRDDAGLPEAAPTLAEILGEAGYRTALVGKWHLGHASAAQRPRARGFAETYGHHRGWIDYFTHEVDGIPDWHRNGALAPETGYATDLIAAEATRVIEGHGPGAPLFLMVTFNAPHTPLQGPRGGAGGGPRATYAAMVESLDEGVGQVLDALDQKGLSDQTLVWFLSDNGAHPKYGGSNGELKGGKYTCDEGGLRVPSCVRLPGHVVAGVSREFMGTIDVAPTVAALVRTGPMVDAEGVDAGPALFDGAALPERPFVFAVDHARVQRRAILLAPWKLIEERRQGEVVRSLYDVVADPLEGSDLSGGREEVVQRLLDAAPWIDR